MQIRSGGFLVELQDTQNSVHRGPESAVLDPGVGVMLNTYTGYILIYVSF